MAFKPNRKIPGVPDLDKLRTILNNTHLSNTNNPLYQFLNSLLLGITTIQAYLQKQIDGLNDSSSGIGPGASIVDQIYGLGSIVTPPSSSWSWVNQGPASISTSALGELLNSNTTGTSGDNIIARVRSASAPYVITGCINLVAYCPVDFVGMGLLFRESGSGKLSICGYQQDGGTKYAGFHYNSATSFASTLLEVLTIVNRVLWIRLTDDNVNRIMEVSPDGTNWLTINTEGRTSFLTADQVGFYVQCRNATLAGICELISWS